MKMPIWMSYDFGVNGDYDGLYYWLDNNKAKECGNSIALFYYEYKKDIIAELLKDLKKNIKLRKRDRIYIIYKKEDKYIGKFLIGNRKGSPWEGYSGEENNEDEI